jgi:mannosyltransferase
VSSAPARRRGAAQTDSGAAQTDSGTAQTDSGTAQTDSGAAQTDSDAAPAAPDVTPAADTAAQAGGRRWAAAAARYAPVIGAAGAVTVAGAWGLSRESAMGNDEVVSRWAALLSLRQLAHLLRQVDAVHGLYYLLLHGWMAVGTSPAVMRIPSVTAMAAAAAMLVIIGRRLTGSGWPGLFAGLIMALTPSITYYAQTARSYALVFACVVAETLVLLRAMQAESGGGTRGQAARRWVAYGALVTVGGYLNEMSLLVLAAHAITVLLARYGARAVAHWAAAAAAGAVLVAPLIDFSSGQQAALGAIPRPSLHDVWILYHDYFGATIVAPLLLAACAAIALLPRLRWDRDSDGVAAAAEPGPWWSSGGISLPSVAAPLLLVPAALLMLAALAGPKLYIDRYVLYGEAGAALLAGAGLYRAGRWLGRRALVWAPGAAVCACALLLQLGPLHTVRTPGSRLFDFGGPAQYVGAHARPGDGVLFLSTFFRKARLGYPADFRTTADFALAVPPVVSHPFRGIDKPFTAIGPLMLSYQRIWVIGLRPSPTLPAGLVRDESAVLLHAFSRVTARGYRGMWVTLWTRH